MGATTITIDDFEALLDTLADILEVDSKVEAAEIGLRCLVNILEIDALNVTTEGAYWPGFDPAAYLKSWDDRMRNGAPEDE
jgi:hypothetical protein